MQNVCLENVFKIHAMLYEYFLLTGTNTDIVNFKLSTFVVWKNAIILKQTQKKKTFILNHLSNGNLVYDCILLFVSV